MHFIRNDMKFMELRPNDTKRSYGDVHINPVHTKPSADDIRTHTLPILSETRASYVLTTFTPLRPGVQCHETDRNNVLVRTPLTLNRVLNPTCT